MRASVPHIVAGSQQQFLERAYMSRGGKRHCRHQSVQRFAAGRETGPTQAPGQGIVGRSPTANGRSIALHDRLPVTALIPQAE